MSQFVWNHLFGLLLQIIDDLVVFSRLVIYFKVIGISHYFICTMKLAPNSNIFLCIFKISDRLSIQILWKLLNFVKIIILSNILIFIDLLPVPFNT
jgi:hypothetical protein